MSGSQRPSTPFPTHGTPNDDSIYCRRPDGTVYAVLTPREWRKLQAQGELNQYLADLR